MSFSRLLYAAPLLYALMSVACAGSVSAQSLDLASAKPVDLTHPIDENTIYWPTETDAFELKERFKGITEGGYFYSAYSFCSPEHGGTHIDAPFHFAKNGETIDQIPLERLVAPVVVIDVSEQATKDPDYTLSAEDVSAWEEKHGRITAGAIVLLRTGWSKRWPDRLAYLGDDTPGDASKLHFPSYGPEGAKALVARGIAMLGVDTASIDSGASKDFLVHRITGEANIAGIENLTNLDQLPATGAWVMALPMKIAKGSGAPARVIAFVP